jgi:hypothetical protein
MVVVPARSPIETVKKCRRNTPVLSTSLERCVIPAKAGIQCGGCGAACVFWIPAFAGMTPFWYFFTSSLGERSVIDALLLK